jgi:hypothetical protein
MQAWPGGHGGISQFNGLSWLSLGIILEEFSAVSFWTFLASSISLVSNGKSWS